MTTTEKPITRLRDLKSGVRDLIMMDPSIIVIESGHNPRDYSLPENRDHLEDLKESIREHGVKSPLWVRFDAGTKSAILVDGECRLRALIELIEEGVQILTVPVIQVESGDRASRLVLALTANTGKPLSKLEHGAAFKKLQSYGWDDEKIAGNACQKPRYIREAIELAESPQAVKEMVSNGSVTPAAALKSVRSKGDAAAADLSAKVEKSNGAKVKRERVESGMKITESQSTEIQEALSFYAGYFQDETGDKARNALAIFKK